MIIKIKKKLVLFIINNFLKGTKFFKIKNKMMKWCGFDIGVNTNIVGPLYISLSIDLKIGDNCWIGRGFTIDGNGSVNIMNNVDIAPEVLISTGSHYIGSNNKRAGIGKTLSTKIEDGCWIGTRAMLIEGCNVSKGSIVSAGSIVKDNYDENSLISIEFAVCKKRLI